MPSTVFIKNFSPVPLPPASGSLGTGLISASGIKSNGTTYTPRLATGGPNGDPCWDITGNSGSSRGILFNLDTTQIALNTSYTFTALVNAPVNGTSIILTSNSFGAGTANTNSTVFTSNGTWTLLTLTARTGTAWSGTPSFGVAVQGSSSTTLIEYYVAKTMIAKGKTAQPYSDGNSLGWNWLGTSGISISQGPMSPYSLPDPTPPLIFEVYRNTNLTGAPVEILNGRMNPTYLEELKGPGGGSFDIMVDDPKILADPTLLDYRNVIKVRRGAQYIGAFVIQSTSEVYVDSENEDAGRIISVSGEGLRTWFHDAIVYPYGGITSTASDSRTFSWMSEQGSWYVPSQWKTPVKIMQPSKPNMTLGWKNTSAQGMPVNTTWWIWDRAESATKFPPNGYVYFRYEWNASVPENYNVYVAADDTYTVYIDGDSIIDSGTYGVSNWQQTQQGSVVLEKGHHILAVRVKNWGGIAGLNLMLRSTGNTAKPVAEYTVTSTGASGWVCYGYPATEPGWTSGSVILKLLAEAKARGVGFAKNLIPTFTDTTDSNGVPWADNQAWTFNVGDDLETVLESLEGLSCNFYVEPTTYKFYAYKNRGVDSGIGSTNPVYYRAGQDIISAAEDTTGAVKNALLVKTSDGWSEATSSNATSGTNYGRVEGTVQVDGGTDLAKAVASYAFEEFSTPSTSATYEIINIEGKTPWTDVNVGDLVAAPKRGYLQYLDRRIYSLSCGEDEAGNPVYAIEFDTIPTERIDRLEQMLENITAGTSTELLGAMSNIGIVKINSSADSSTAPPSTPVTPSTVAPVAPTNVIGTASPGYTSAGVAENTVMLTWNPVVADIKGNTIEVNTYEVWVRYAGQKTSTSLATVVTNSYSNSNFPVGTTAYFTVRAQSAGGTWSVFTSEILVSLQTPFLTMDAPSAPIIISSPSGAQAHWDGLLGEATPPPQFAYVYAETSTGETGTYIQQGGTLHGSGDITLPVSTAASLWVRFVAVDAQGNKSLPSISTQITSQPSAPQNFFIASNIGTWDANGTAISVVTLQWDAVTTDVLGNSITIDFYELWSHQGAADPKRMMTTVTGTSVPVVMTPNDETQFSVRAHSTVNAYSLFTTDLDVIPAQPTEVLSVPTAPALETGHGALTAYWDGTLDGSDTLPPQFWHVLTERASDEDGPWSPVGGPLEKAGSITITDVSQGDIVWIRFTAYDHLGVASGSSDPISVTVVGVDADDIVAGSITVNQLSPTIGGDIDITANDTVTIIAGQISDVQDGLNDTDDNLASMQTIYQFGDDGALISSPDSTFELKLTNEDIEILQQGQVVSYWNAGQMFVDSFVGTEVTLGNHKLQKYLTGTVVRAL